MGVAPVRIEAQLLGLLGGRLAKLGASVPGVDAEQGREAVEQALALLIPHVAALAAHQDRDLVMLVVGAHPREMHPEMTPCQLLKPAGSPLAGLQPVQGPARHRPPRTSVAYPLRT